MSKENVDDHPRNKLNNFRNEDELFDTSLSSENLNSIDKLNLSNNHEKNNYETTITLTNTDDTSHKKKIGTNIVDSSDLDKAECEFLIEKITSNENILNSQEANLLYGVVEKMNDNIFNTNTGLSDINTQQFMELNLKGAFKRLNAILPASDLDSSETHTINQINSDKSTVISPPLINELRNSEIKNKNSIIVNDSKKSENINYSSSKIDLELSIQDHYVEYPGEDQDPEIIAFRVMCETLLKIGAVDNNIIDNNKTIVKKNNRLNKHDNKKLKPNHNYNVISCSNSTKYEPSTSKLNAFKGVNNTSKRLAHKRHQIHDLRFDSSDDSSPEYSNELSYKQYNSNTKISKITFSQNNSKSNAKCYPDTDMIQPNNAKKTKLSDLTFKDKEVDCMLIENKRPKVQNVINNLKCKNINDDSLEQTNQLKENQTIFYFLATGKVHLDMLNSIEEKNCHSI